jgi:adenylate kinase
MGKVILLTGAPATGKSTLRAKLAEALPTLKEFDYGQRLREAKAERGTSISYADLRTQSSQVIHSSDVKKLDEQIIGEIATIRREYDVLIDSHAVTREHFGFRAIPFSLSQLSRLMLDAVMVLSCDPPELLKRMDHNREGRRDVTQTQALQHQTLQQSLALTYAVACGCPLYLIDVTSLDPEGVLQEARNAMRTVGVSGVG